MKFSAAMKALEEGKKVRRPFWEPYSWIDNSFGHVAFLSQKPKGILGMMGYKADSKDIQAADWELYEEAKPKLNFSQVVKGLQHGKRFRRIDWKEDRSTIHMGYYKSYIWDQHSKPSGFSVEDFEATDWFEVE